MKVAILGPEGTYTHQAADQYFGEKLEPVFYSTITEVFESEESRKIIPIENTLGGDVEESIEQFQQISNLRIEAEQKIPINHCLISNEKLEDIEAVKSHPQALSQCQSYIKNNNWKKEETGSTAKAVTQLEESKAAIASKIAAEINQAPIIEKNIQDNKQNQTRFFIIRTEKVREESREPEKTSLIIEPEEDRPGILHEILEKFAEKEINLTHIQSRPKKTKLGEYYFYIEANIKNKTQEFEEAKKQIKNIADVKTLGKYPKGEK